MICITASAAESDPAGSPGVEHHVGKFVFVEILTPDLAGAKAFYGPLFGWRFQDVQIGSVHYTDATNSDRRVAGLVNLPMKAGQKRQPAWLSFVSVADVDATTAAAIGNGGRTLSAPHEVAGLGRIAVFDDPQGAVFAMMSAPTGDPADALADPSEWIWTSLYTTDPDAASAFYQKLVDYEVFDAPEPGNDQHTTLASGGYARASVTPLPAAAAHPYWLRYVRVDDATSTIAKTVSLGGKVLLSPRDDRHGGKVGIVAAPQGAPFHLLEWSDDRTQKASP